MMAKTKPWTIASARRNLPTLIGMAAREPQRVYRRNKLVATVVDPRIAEEAIQAERPSLTDAFAELQKICTEDHYQLVVPPRKNRAPAKPARKRRKR
ncbi:MAG: hypothetical protein SFX73_34555 [Kofleriaceae bacterium]|nr:hypothetical protein [Kofleriaceae bacterium]